MHPRNRHQGRYDFHELKKALPELTPFIVNKFGNETINFDDPEAVKTLNRALLKSFYGISGWDIPDDYLCPPIPGRADYIHTIADLVSEMKVSVLDIGTGANCIYPLIGHAEYQWSFVASDVDPVAIKNGRSILSKNNLSSAIELRLQPDPKNIFRGIILPGEYYHLTMCNPPFHSSKEEALKGTLRKWKNLGKKISTLNFGGKANELWFPGGEKAFITSMIRESREFRAQCRWFTTLVSKEENLRELGQVLKTAGAAETRIISMEQGQKKSRVLAWTFH